MVHRTGSTYALDTEFPKSSYFGGEHVATFFQVMVYHLGTRDSMLVGVRRCLNRSEVTVRMEDNNHVPVETDTSLPCLIKGKLNDSTGVHNLITHIPPCRWLLIHPI